MNILLIVTITLTVLAIAFLFGFWIKRIRLENDRRYIERMNKKYKNVIDQWGRIPKAGDGKMVRLFIALVTLIAINGCKQVEFNAPHLIWQTRHESYKVVQDDFNRLFISATKHLGEGNADSARYYSAQMQYNLEIRSMLPK